MHERKVYLREKHKLYALNVNMSVLSKGLDMICKAFLEATCGIFLISRDVISFLNATKKSFKEIAEDFG